MRDLRKIVLPSHVRHGTPNAYHNYGCRCDPCRTAAADYRYDQRRRDDHWRLYMREYMRRYRAAKKSGPPTNANSDSDP